MLMIVPVALSCGVPLLLAIAGLVLGTLVSRIGGGARAVTPVFAMVPLITVTLTRHGVEGLVAAGVLAGLLLIVFGNLRLARAFRAAPPLVVPALSLAALVELMRAPIPSNAWSVDPHRFVTLPLAAIVLVSLHMALLTALAARPCRDRDLVASGLATTAGALLCGVPLGVGGRWAVPTRDELVPAAVTLGCALSLGHGRGVLVATIFALIALVRRPRTQVAEQVIPRAQPAGGPSFFRHPIRRPDSPRSLRPDGDRGSGPPLR